MSEKIIHLTGAPPIAIEDAEWPEVGRAWWADGPVKKNAARRAWVRVRQHADGRCIVYGLRSEPEQECKVGYLLEAHVSAKEVVGVVTAVCAIVGVSEQAVFDSMPPSSI